MIRTSSKTSSLNSTQRGSAAKHEEYWHEHKGVVKCPICGNVHFTKRWYASEKVLASHLGENKLEIAETKVCPACQMVKNGTFEGEVFVEGCPVQHAEELLNMVNNFGVHAVEKDPQHRVIKTEVIANGYRITTTENQFAVKIAKKIEESFGHKATVKISYSAEPAEVARVHVTFHS